MRTKRRVLTVAAAAAVSALLAACGSSSGSSTGSTSAGPVKIGIDLTYNNTAFWSAYINYEQQDAKQMKIKLLGPLLAAADASLQN